VREEGGDGPVPAGESSGARQHRRGARARRRMERGRRRRERHGERDISPRTGDRFYSRALAPQMSTRGAIAWPGAVHVDAPYTRTNGRGLPWLPFYSRLKRYLILYTPLQVSRRNRSGHQGSQKKNLAATYIKDIINIYVYKTKFCYKFTYITFVFLNLT
jgi:hypothetical protein